MFALKGFRRSSWPINSNVDGCLHTAISAWLLKKLQNTGICSVAGMGKSRRPARGLELVENWPEKAVNDTRIWT